MKCNTQQTLVIVVTAILYGLFAVGALAQVGIFTKEDLIAYTPFWQGERFPDGRPKVPDEILERMKEVSIDDAYDFIRSRVEPGFSRQFERGWLRSHDNPVMVGRALTAVFMPLRPDLDQVVRAKGEEEGRKGSYIGWVIDDVVDGDVLVVDMFGKLDNGTFIGETLGNQVYKKGGRGLVIDGGGHDIPGLRKLENFNTFVREWAPTHQSDVTLMGINTPIHIGQATVLPGDVVLTGRMGVLFIPAHLAQDVIDYHDKLFSDTK